MSSPTRTSRRLLQLLAGLVVLAVLAAVGFYVFERFERSEIAAKAEVACPSAPPAGTALPLDLPLPQGGTVRSVAEQGRTSVSLIDVPGGLDDIVRVRDAVVSDLQGAGYELVDTDQEPGYEAEAEVAGPHDGTLRVKPLCEGVLEVRYAVQQ